MSEIESLQLVAGAPSPRAVPPCAVLFYDAHVLLISGARSVLTRVNILSAFGHIVIIKPTYLTKNDLNGL